MKDFSGLSSSRRPLVNSRHGDWALNSGFLHDRRMANAESGARLCADTYRRLYRRRKDVRDLPGSHPYLIPYSEMFMSPSFINKE